MPIKVVYLDDEELLCQVFQEYLSCPEIEVVVFSNEELAIEYCNNNPLDLIFIDYRLKNTTGEYVANALTTTAIKVLVTGELDIEASQHFLKVIEKPYKLSEMKKIIYSLLSN